MFDPAEMAKALGRAQRTGEGWCCRCPAHDDRNPSLSINLADDGRPLVHCHAGCSQAAVIEALRKRNLWPSETREIGATENCKRRRLGASHHVAPVPKQAPEVPRTHPKLGEPSKVWTYRDVHGEVLGYQARFDMPNGAKEFRPLSLWKDRQGNLIWQWRGLPVPHPLYGLDRLAKRPAAPVLVVEGEKCADAAADLLPDYVVVSWSHGSKSVDKTDWSLMHRRVVHVWPDADESGQTAMERVCQECHRAGAASIRAVQVPDNVKSGWDVADLAKEDDAGTVALCLLDDAETYRTTPPSNSQPVIADWSAARFFGPAPERVWLIDGTIPLGVPVMLATAGGLGKSMLCLQLALTVAYGDELDGQARSVIGGPVAQHGSVVILTAEDDKSEIHRRLNILDPENTRKCHPDRLYVVPLPDAGGMITFIRGGFDEPELTDEARSIIEQLKETPHLRLVVLDPLQAFVGADINRDPAVGQRFCGLLGTIASETGATVLVTHHLRKAGQHDISSLNAARDSIRGTTALVDGVRCVYVIWTPSDAQCKEVCRRLDISHSPNRIAHGAVVKSNWPTDREIHEYVRNDDGLLEFAGDANADDKSLRRRQLDDLELSIAQAARAGKPFTKTGSSGLYENRGRLMGSAAELSRNKLVELADELLRAGRVIQVATGKSRRLVWLDVPHGRCTREDDDKK